MPEPSNGITAEVIQDLMPDFTLGADLLRTIAGAIPAPPEGVSRAWRRDRCARIIEETAAFAPADAAQGRLAAQMLILRDMADDTFARSRGPGLTLAEVLRARSLGDRLSCSAERMERALARRQQKPTPFWGNVTASALTISEVDAEWGRGAPGGGEVGEEKEEGMDAGPPASAGAGPAGMTGARTGATDEPPRRSRAGVTVEYGDGYSQEVWPAVRRSGSDVSGTAGSA
jgi:hypothetical protein